MFLRYALTALVAVVFTLLMVAAIEYEGGDQRLLVEEGHWGQWVVQSTSGKTGIQFSFVDSTGAQTQDYLWFDATGKYVASGPP